MGHPDVCWSEEWATRLDSDERRIISAWRSEPHERREYWKDIKRLSH
jgi:hypothetical protein